MSFEEDLDNSQISRDTTKFGQIEHEFSPNIINGNKYQEDEQLKKLQKKIPAVFSRLWDYKNARDNKLREEREQSREKEEEDWMMKLAGTNQLQKKFEGLTVY